MDRQIVEKQAGMIIMNINDNRIEDAKKGDQAAMSSLLMEYKGIVSSVVNRMVFDYDYHRDIIQNVFFKVVSGIGEFNNKCRFSTWIYRIAVNESIEYLRKRGYFEKLKSEFNGFDLSGMSSDHNEGLDMLSKKEILDWINEAVNECPLGEKSAFSLFYYSGFSGKDASEVMKISEDNFYMKLKAARDRVRLALRKRGVAV